jgi:alpha-N-arabinofuranosidase
MINEFYNVTGLDYPHMVGEFASITPNGGGGFDAGLMPFPWWIGSVGEAVALVGYEHYSADIPSALFAPTLRNMNRWQWSVTIVQFAADPKLTTRSTSWHVWNLLAAHPISHTLSATEAYNPIFHVSGINAEKGSHIWKAAAYNTTHGADVPVSVSFDGVRPGTKADVTVLTSKDPYGYNDPHKGNNVVDYKTFTLQSDDKGAFCFSLPNLSVAVLETVSGHGKRGAGADSIAQPFHA